MFSFAPQTYLANYDENERTVSARPHDALLSSIPISPRKYQGRLLPAIRIAPWVIHCILLSASAVMFFAHRPDSQTCPESWYPIIGEHAPVHNIRFRGNLEHISPYKGPPSKSVDEAWAAITPQVGVMSISEEVYRTLNASKHAVKLPPEAGGGYMAIFEGIHLIHCVKALWEATYPSYYTDQRTMNAEELFEWHRHLDHCADILRQKLMCDADANLIVYNWVQNHYAPKPNFNVQHKCRNYQHLLGVAANLKADGSHSNNGWILRPSDTPVVEFEKPPLDPDADR